MAVKHSRNMANEEAKGGFAMTPVARRPLSHIRKEFIWQRGKKKDPLLSLTTIWYLRSQSVIKNHLKKEIQ